MKQLLDKSDLLNIIDYEKQRGTYRKDLIEYKKKRRFNLGPNILITFENSETMKFQIQEMMRAERMVHDHQVEEELNIYNPLIPKGGELSATLFIEITQPEKIRPVLDGFIGLTKSKSVYFEVNGSKVSAEFESGREREDNISSVHYIRFSFNDINEKEFSEQSSKVNLCIDFNDYKHFTTLSEDNKKSLSSDFV